MFTCTGCSARCPWSSCTTLRLPQPACLPSSSLPFGRSSGWRPAQVAPAVPALCITAPHHMHASLCMHMPAVKMTRVMSEPPCSVYLTYIHVYGFSVCFLHVHAETRIPLCMQGDVCSCPRTIAHSMNNATSDRAKAHASAVLYLTLCIARQPGQDKCIQTCVSRRELTHPDLRV